MPPQPVFKPGAVKAMSVSAGGFIFAMTDDGQLWQGQILGPSGRTWQALFPCAHVVWSTAPVEQVISI